MIAANMGKVLAHIIQGRGGGGSWRFGRRSCGGPSPSRRAGRTATKTGSSERLAGSEPEAVGAGITDT